MGCRTEPHSEYWSLGDVAVTPLFLRWLGASVAGYPLCPVCPCEGSWVSFCECPVPSRSHCLYYEALGRCRLLRDAIVEHMMVFRVIDCSRRASSARSPHGARSTLALS